MKRYNLSFYNASSADPQEAVLRVTYTQPERMVGELRASRFKISKGAFPLFYLGPDDRRFSTEEKNDIDTLDMTPTGLVWGFMFSGNTIIPCGSDTYLLSLEQGPVPCEEPTTRVYRPIHVNYSHVYINRHPVWVKRGEGWYLRNESVPVFDWKQLINNNSADFRLRSFTSIPSKCYPTTERNGVKFTIEVIDRDEARVTTPVCFLSTKAFKIIATDTTSDSSYSFDPTVIRSINDPWLTNTERLFTPSGDVTYSKQLEGIIASNAPRPSIVDLSTSVYYPYSVGSANMLFPYTAILIVIDELNFVGDNIVVNNSDLSGVISPSMLSVFKTYIVGMDGNERSDYVVVDDTITQSPLQINCPSLNTLTIRLLMLTKDNRLVKMKIPRDEGFFLQLTIR